MPLASSALVALAAVNTVQRHPLPPSQSRMPLPPRSSAATAATNPQLEMQRGWLVAQRSSQAVSSQLQAVAAKHFVPLAAVQMGMVRLTSDIVGHSMHAAAIDPTHAMAMTFTGVTCSGAGGALWLRYLEDQLGPNEAGSHRLVLLKTALDYVCWSPTVNSANLFLIPLLMGHGLDASLTSMTTGLPSLMLYELCIFGPYNLLGFSLIPPDLRPSAKALASFVFSILLSLSC